MTKPVVNIHEAETTTVNPDGSARFGATIARLGDAIGSKQLGCAYMQVEPGKRAYPFHCHHGNEEMMIILEGEGSYRFGDQTYPIKSGDICAAPAGGPETAIRSSIPARQCCDISACRQRTIRIFASIRTAASSRPLPLARDEVSATRNL
ncbi:cupin domain-containing protein [Halovulum sp. GXIMD14793]